jgi:hypothetical protein
MAVRCAVVIRGMSTPLVVLTISNTALVFGMVVLIPIWAKMPGTPPNKRLTKMT